MKVKRSKSGLPVLTENGGGMSNTGRATIITGYNGDKLKPLFIPKGYANGEHAIFVVKPGYHVIESRINRSGEYVNVYKIVRIGRDDDPDYVELEEVGGYENGDTNLPDKFDEAVTVALKKAYCYHCRCVHYAIR